MDEAVFTAISTQHMSSFYRTAYSIVRNRPDAEDAVQQALLRAWQARSKAREGAERAWMMRIVINECYTLLRRRHRETVVEDLPSLAVASGPPQTGLYEAIQALPESLRTPFLLKYMEDMTEKEVAAAMGLALPSVKNRLFRARKILQKEMEKEADA